MFNDLKIKKEALPSNIPVFPLTGSCLLPGTELPLNIFEPKFINMVDDAMAEKRLIGMIQPKQGLFSNIKKSKPLYDVGCVGRIKAFNETEDGRYLIVLSGISRFETVEEIETIRGYRRFKVDFDKFENDFSIEKERKIFTSNFERKELFEKVDAYIQRVGDVKDSLSSYNNFDNLTDGFILDFICGFMPFSPQEKQLFLECLTVEERSKTLYKILGIAEAEKKYLKSKYLN